MRYVRVAHVSEFRGRRFKTFRLLGRPVGVFPETGGGFYALEMRCKHQNWDLSTGPLEGDIITCPRHGWRYNIRTGACENQPSAPLRRHGVRVEDGYVYVSLTPEDSDSADASGLPFGDAVPPGE